MNKLDFLRCVALVSAIVIIILLTMARTAYICGANTGGMQDYRATIESNKTKIKQCEEIKIQLHNTAEAIRKQEFHDKEFVDSLSKKWWAQHSLQQRLILENEELHTRIKKMEKEIASHQYIGDFTITHYCSQKYSHICNSGYPFKTSVGTTPTPGRTIAVDPKKIPYGTKVIIDGHTYIAEDCGGAIKGNKIDICVATHSEALQKGVRRNVPVYIIKE